MVDSISNRVSLNLQNNKVNIAVSSILVLASATLTVVYPSFLLLGATFTAIFGIYAFYSFIKNPSIQGSASPIDQRTERAVSGMTDCLDLPRSIDTVAERLQIVDEKSGTSYVSFINHAYEDEYGAGDCLSVWKIHISINPKDRDRAWSIIMPIIKETQLRIHGKIHQAITEEDVQPGKEIALIVDSTQTNIRLWQVFLTKVANELFNNGILPDTRPINSDPEQATRKWDATIKTKEGVPSYFNYRSDLYTVIEDALWQDIYADVQGNIFQNQIKQSYYTSLAEGQKHNPLNEEDFLKDIII